MPSNNQSDGMLTFGGHLEVLRQMLIRIIGAAGVLAVLCFCFKEQTFSILLAPSKCDFVTYRWIERVLSGIGMDFKFEEFHVNMIATDLSSQFMTHISTSAILGLLGSSPYILYELFRFISPALYDNEKRNSVLVVGIIYFLFILGVLMSYFVLFPISFRFLGTYSVAESVENNITLDSYISTFTSLTFLMGLVFQLPVIAYVLGRMNLISSNLLRRFRKHAFVVILLLAAIITPPDLMTLVLVAIPLYLLYEISIWVLKFNRVRQSA